MTLTVPRSAQASRQHGVYVRAQALSRVAAPVLSGLKVYDQIEDLKGKAFHDPIALLPESLEEEAPSTGLAHPEKWRESFYTWLGKHVGPSPEGTMIINLQRSYLTYPIYSDGENFALSFGKLLKFRADTRILATKTLLALAATASYVLDLSQSILPSTTTCFTRL